MIGFCRHPGSGGHGHHAMVRQVARVIGIGIETADMLVNEVLSRPMRDRKAVARYAGLTGSPDESGARRREQGLAKAGNARVPHGSSPWAEGPRGMIQRAWRFLRFQKDSTGAMVPGPPQEPPGQRRKLNAYQPRVDDFQGRVGRRDSGRLEGHTRQSNLRRPRYSVAFSAVLNIG